ncbi:GNAT family N-acetyltransferase [Flavihumibacter sp. CACIAM 22H1]|uniref:GNAT family N-acetyltransferase n=1 Tax=Flavihumibacter sp. CACIAM 22H1 TaxID=1812911 RepID=UPI0007A83B84|nr:GNAT family N-acetyltransferase [Flavihumibacter sp. CACIAM 22H1]KYP13144.1 MAG: GNAT family acetyltransferase [Flavihumibacter sp. CACIAM 22H1]
MAVLNIYRDNYLISTDQSRLDISAIHRFLSTEAYWSLNIPREKMEKSIKHSLCFGVYRLDKQIGFARVISDFATIAYLGDLYILDAYRGKGLSKWLLEVIMGHPELQGLRRWILLTADAHALYKQFGWTEIADPAKWMELHNKSVYT